MALYDPNGVRVKMQDTSQVRVKLTGKALVGIQFTTPPTTTEYFVGDTMDWTGVVVSTVNEMGTAIEDVTSQCTFSPVSGYEFTVSDISNYKQLTATCTIDGVTYTAIMTCKVEAVPTLETRTWSQISDDIKTGKISRYTSAGDTKTFSFDDGAFTLEAELVNIGTGTGDGGAWYPQGTADFVIRKLLPSSNDRYRTSWAANTTVGWWWGNSNIRQFVNGNLYDMLPSDLKDVIINKNHLYAKSDGTFEECADKLWLPTCFEIYGSQSTYCWDSSTQNRNFFANGSRRKQPVNSQTYTSYGTSTVNNGNAAYVRTNTESVPSTTTFTGKPTIAFGFRLGQA